MAHEGTPRRTTGTAIARRPGGRSRVAVVLGIFAAIGLSFTGARDVGAVGTGTNLVTSFTPSTLRNDFDGWVGMRLQGGSSDLSVNGLGRWVVSGNSQAHDVRLVDASTGTDVATATVTTSGQPAGAFAFTDLGTPVTLRAGGTYYLLSREFSGGDNWYDYATAAVTTAAASDTGSVWATSGAPTTFNPGGTAGQAYGLPNLRYNVANAAPAVTSQPADQTVTAGDAAVFSAAASGVPTPTVQWESKPPAGSFAPIGGATSTVLTVSGTTVGMSGTQYRAVFSNTSGPPATTNAATLTVNASPPPAGTALVTYFTPSSPRNDFNGWVGMRLQGGSTDISVTALGRWVLAGNSQAHTVRLVNAGTGVELASASVATSGQPAGAFTFTALPTAVTMQANTSYYLLSQETAGGDTWYDYNSSTITTSAASDTGVVWATSAAPNAFNAGGSASQAFVVPNLRYTSVNAAPAVTQQPADQTVAAGGTAVFSAAASGVPTPSVQWESKPSAGSFAPIGGATSTVLNVPNLTLADSGTQYRAVFSNSSGPSATTNAATLTVTAGPPAGGTPLVTFFSPSALRNDFSGWVGMRFSVGASNLSVGSVGRWVVSGNSQSHTVRIVNAGTGADVASANVVTSGAPAGAFAYANLASPVTLSANTTYYLLSQESAGGDTWYDFDTSTVTTSVASDTGVVWATTAAPGTFNPGGSAGQSYVVPNFRYTVLNATPTDIALTATSVAENQASGTTVGTFSTTDPDAGDTFTYTLVSGTGSTDNASFTITGNSLKTAASFDFETKSSYAIRVRSTDSGSATFEKQFTITVTNVNEAPTDIALTSTSVAENQASGTTVGTFSTTDPDAGDTFTYTLVAGTGSTDNASFTITGNSLKTAASFNFETKSSYAIRVRSTDAGTLNFEKQFTITVTNVNEAPTDIALTATSIAENQASGTTVGTFSTTDPDAGDTFTYTLVTGTGSTDNASFTISGNSLKTAAAFNFEVKNSYAIRVRSTDAGTLFTEKQFTITVTNVNEAPTDIALTVTSVAENQASGTTVGTLSSTDPDAGDTFTYTLVAGTGSDDNASFTITGNTLKTAASFDFETKSSYLIRVRSTDAGTLFFEKQFTITVTNANDAPTDITLSATSVAENLPSGTTVGTLTGVDQDAGQTQTFTLVSGTGSTDNASFTITGNTLKTAASFNFEVKNSYSIRIRTTDNGTPTNLFFEKAFTISITDVNDPPVAVSDSYSGAIGNTLFVLNSGGSGPKVTVTGSVLTANDTDEDATLPHTLAAVAETVTSTRGGTATIAANGNFTFLPKAGDKSVSDTFTYHVTDGSLSTAGTVTVAIGPDIAWYVDNSLGVNGDGRSSSPFNTLANINGSGDADGPGDYLFLFQGSGNYTGGLVLEANQRLSGQPEGFVVGAQTLRAGDGSNPTITNTGGVGITLANDNVIRRVNVTGTSAQGISGGAITNADIGPNLSITNSTGVGFSLNGAASGTVTMAGSITHSSGSARSVFIQNRTGGTVTISGPINDTGGGIFMNTNTGTTMNFTGGITSSTGSNGGAFTAQGGGTVSVTGTNTLTTTGAVALTVSSTNIGASGLTFQSINAGSGATPPNGIILNGTGSSGGLTVTGTGSPVTAGSGGTIQNTTGAGISLTNVGGVVSLSGMATSAVAGADVLVSGGAANVTYAGTITNSGGRSVDVSGKTGGTALFSGAINDTGTGISLTNNTGATINFTGGLSLSTAGNDAFTATGGGTVNVTGTNTVTTTTGIAVKVTGTNIGASHVTFQSVTAGTAASGPTNGILINGTGTAGSFRVTGTGAANSGGTIQHTSGDGISLTSTKGASFDRMNIQNTGRSGVRGGSSDTGGNTDVVANLTDFTFTNGTINNSGTALGVDDSNIGINTTGSGGGEQNIVGTITITGNTLTNAFYQGIDIDNTRGTIDNANISNNTITSSTSTASSKGGGIRFIAQGDAGGVANITKATLDNNTITNFPSGVGLQVQCGNAASSSAPAGTCGTPGNATNIINITNNPVHGNSPTVRTGAEGMVFVVNGRGQGNFNITGNDIRNTTGQAMSMSSFGFANTTATISNNTIVANNTVASPGIGVGTSKAFTSADTPTLTATITSNNISAADGNGILAVARDSTGTLKVKIQNNTVGASLSGVRPGIRIDSGNASSVNETVCANISGNTSAGSGGTQGIGLRKQGGVSTTNAFGVNGMSATATPGVENYVNGLNPAGNGTLLISATSGFSNCSLP